MMARPGYDAAQAGHPDYNGLLEKVQSRLAFQRSASRNLGR
jgi:hypothetical protein